jgi:undecaprenyl-diphosphatase
MTAARFLGIERPDAARFSFLLSIPATLAAGGLLGLELWRAQQMLDHHILMGVLAALISAWAAIAFLMRWLQTATFTPFVIYRWLLGLVLLSYGYGLAVGLALLALAGLFVWLVSRPFPLRRQERAI